MMNIAVILAAGKGTRIKHADKPKQFLNIGGKPILCYTVDKFLDCKQIDHIAVAVCKDWIPYTKALFAERGSDRISICEGGSNRQESLYRALIHCQIELGVLDDAIIISHDAARPFVTRRIIEENIKAMKQVDAVNTVIPAIDTIIQSSDGKTIISIPDRSQMYQVQTPQTFRLGQFIDIYRTLSEDYLAKVTDAAKIFVEHGDKVRLVRGEPFNFKITTGYDFLVAEYLLNQRHS